MTRTYTVLSHAMASLAVVLLALGLLAVPIQEARASDCSPPCGENQTCDGGQCVSTCPAVCDGTCAFATDHCKDGYTCTGSNCPEECGCDDSLSTIGCACQ